VEGSQIGSYRIVRPLGKGGMGIVYEAEHVLIGKRAAVKTLRAELSANRDTVQRFFNEARATTQIHHPGIVDVFDFGFATDGTAFLVMELLEGESLGARRRRAPMTVGLVLAIVRQVASAVEAAHAKGIVHRDLKPDNIFLVPHADIPAGVQCKVLDFGIAKLQQVQAPDDAGSPATRTGALLGTPLYMSPEQCRGIATIDHRADIYSLGCIFYELIAGRVPFGGEGVGDILIAHVHEVPRDPSVEHPELPSDVVALAGQMLAKKPAARPRSMAAVVEAIDRLVASLGDAVDLTLSWASGGAIDAMAATAASTDRDSDALAATATPVERVPSMLVAETVAATTERRDPTPTLPADTTLGASAGSTANAPASGSRRALLLGGGAALALGGVYGATRLLGGGGKPAAPPKPPTLVRIGFRLPRDTTELLDEPSLVVLPEHGDPIKLKPQGRLAPDKQITRSLVVLVEATERYLGNLPDDDVSEPIDGARANIASVLAYSVGWATEVRIALFSRRFEVLPPGHEPSKFVTRSVTGVFGSDLSEGVRRAADLLRGETDHYLLVLGTGNFLEVQPRAEEIAAVVKVLQQRAVHATAIVGDWVDGDQVDHGALAKVFPDLREVKAHGDIEQTAYDWSQQLPLPWTLTFELPADVDAASAMFTIGGEPRTVDIYEASDHRLDLGDLKLS
jgi:serine/threonine-protein kinase